MSDQRWTCLLCPTSGTTVTPGGDPEGGPPAGWHHIAGRLLCPQHAHDDQAFRAMVAQLPRHASFGWAGGMYWLEQVNGYTIRSVDAHPTPYEALMAWAQAQPEIPVAEVGGDG